MKLGATFGVLILALIAVVTVGVTRMASLNEGISEVISGPAHRLSVAQQIATEVNFVLRYEKNLALTNDEALMRTFDNQITEHRKKIDGLVVEGVSTASEQGKPSWLKVQSQWEAFKPVNDRVRALGLANKNVEAANLSITQSRKVAGELTATIDQLVSIQQDQMQQADKDTNALYTESRTMLIIVAAIATLIAVAGAIWISLLVSNGLKRIGVALDAVAIGDLDQEVKVNSNDEIKDLVNTVNGMTA
ncbi:MAG: HAMP domain-containing protein, partial [Sphingomonas sp.]